MLTCKVRIPTSVHVYVCVRMCVSVRLMLVSKTGIVTHLQFTLYTVWLVFL